MQSRLAILMLIGPLSAAGLSLAQETSPLPPEAVEQMEYYVGSWEGEYTMGGKEIALESSWAWMLDKHCLVGQLVGRDKASGALIAQLHLVGGWCPIAKKYQEWTFDAQGGQAHTIWTVDPDGRRTGKVSGIVERHPAELVNQRKIVDADTMTGVITAAESGGQQWDVPYTMRRRKDAEATQADFQEWGNRLQGQWTGKTTVVGDWPDGSQKQGDVIEVKTTYRWILGKQALEEVSPLADSEARRLHVWDAATRRIKMFSVDQSGTALTVWFGRSGDQWPWTAMGARADGTHLEGRGVTTLAADGLLIVEGDFTLGGQALPKLSAEFRKVTAAPSGAATAQGVQIPTEITQQLEYLVGEWTVEGGTGDEKVTAEYAVEWSPGKQCLVYHAVFSGTEGQEALTALIGWDAATGEIVDWGFSSSRGSGVLRYKPQSPTLWTGVSAGADAQGKRSEGTISLEKQGPDAFIWREINRTLDGQSQPDGELRFRRK